MDEFDALEDFEDGYDNFRKKKQYIHEYGLPEAIVSGYLRRKLTKLYDWQADCLAMEGVLTGGNLIYSAPTSGGKTLVSEILMFRSLVEKKPRGSIFILPFVSIVTEKERYFGSLCEGTDYTVRSFHHDSNVGFGEDFDIAVCTIEKANGLIDYLLSQNALIDRIGSIIVDELHMLGDDHRGYLLEVCLSKVLFFSNPSVRRYLAAEEQKKTSHNGDAVHQDHCSLNFHPDAIQIIGMSATLPNVNTVAQWLSASYFDTSFRPIKLREYYAISGVLYEKLISNESKASPIKSGEGVAWASMRQTTLNDGRELVCAPMIPATFKGESAHLFHSSTPAKIAFEMCAVKDIKSITTQNFKTAPSATDKNCLVNTQRIDGYSTLLTTEAISPGSAPNTVATLFDSKALTSTLESNLPSSLLEDLEKFDAALNSSSTLNVSLICDNSKNELKSPTKNYSHLSNEAAGLRSSSSRTAMMHYTTDVSALATNMSPRLETELLSIKEKALESAETAIRSSSSAMKYQEIEWKASPLSRNVLPEGTSGLKDGDSLLMICHETLILDHSLLIFCPTKRSCEEIGVYLANHLKSMDGLISCDYSEEREPLLWELQASSCGLDVKLEKLIPYGVAYHHSGLTIEEKRIIEKGYRDGWIKVLMATSTLAAGVNLPSRRVVFYTPYIANCFLDPTRYKQMSGRAGRAGQGNHGESIVLCSASEEMKVRKLMSSEPPRLESALCDCKRGLASLILAILNVSKNLGEPSLLITLYQSTFLSAQPSVAADCREELNKSAFSLSNLTCPADTFLHETKPSRSVATQEAADQVLPKLSNTPVNRSSEFDGLEDFPVDFLASSISPKSREAFSTLVPSSDNKSEGEDVFFERVDSKSFKGDVSFQADLPDSGAVVESHFKSFGGLESKTALIKDLPPKEAAMKSVYPELYNGMQFLLTHGQIWYNSSSRKYEVTMQGSAIASSGMTPSEGYYIFMELQDSMEALILQDDLYLVFLVAPINAPSAIKMNWVLFKDMVEKLQPSELRVLQSLSLDWEVITNAARRQVKLTERQQLRYKRLYIALLLLALLREYPIPTICRKFAVSRGDLQALQQAAVSFASMVISISEHVNWWIIGKFIRQIQQRLLYGVKSELLPLMQIPGVNRSIARILFLAGWKSFYVIASTSPHKIQRVLLRTTFTRGQNRNQAALVYAKYLILSARYHGLKKLKERRHAKDF